MSLSSLPRNGRLSRRALGASLLAAAGVIALSACSGTATATTTSASAEGLTPITIAFAPVADFAPVYIAIDKGYFADEGLEVTPQTGQNAAAVVPSVLNGQLQFAASAVPPFLKALEQGLAIEAVANVVSVQPNAADDQSAVVVNADSPVQSAKDLEGKTVAVNQLGSISHVTTAAAVRADGGDFNKVTFVAMPFPDMVAALERGAIDAAAVLEPFAAQAVAGGARVVSNPSSATLTPGGTAVLFFTSQQYADANPEVLAKFKAAIDKASRDAAADRALVGEVLAEYANVDPATFDAMRLGLYSDELNTEAISNTAALMVELGLLNQPVDVSQHVWQPTP